MKKFKVALILCLGLILYMGWNVLQDTDALVQSWQKEDRRFEDIAFVTADNKGNFYVIDQYRTRLVKLDPQGNFVFEIDQSGLIQAADSSFDELVVDEKGNIYAVCNVADDESHNITKSEICQYGPDGYFAGVLESISHPQGRASRGNYIDLKIIQDDLYYYITSGNTTTLYKISLKDGSKTKSSAFSTGDIDNLYEVAGSSEEALFYETYDRKIYRTDITGTTEEVFNGSDEDLTKEIVPRNLVVEPDGTLYFLDVIRSRLYRIMPGNDFNPDEFISLENLIQGSTEGYTALMPIADGKILVAGQDSYVILDQHGAVLKNSSIAGMTWDERVRVALIWAQAIACILLLIAVILLLYFKILNRRLGLFFKYALVLIPAVIILMSLVGGYIYVVFSENIIEETFDTLAVVSHSGSILFNGDVLDSIKTPEECTEPGFKSLLNKMDKILAADSGDQKISGIYAVIYKKVGDRIYILYDHDWNSMPFTLYADDYRTSTMAELLSGGADVASRSDSDVNGQYMDYATPIYNSRNEIVGAFEAGISKNRIDNTLKSLRLWFLLILFCSTLIIALLILLTNRFILTSLNTLRKGVYDISNGNLDVLVDVNTRDEIGDLCIGFNTMADYIRDSIKRSKQTSAAYYRFVPERMLQLLGKAGITNIETGDTVKRNMSVMHLNLRSFYSISASLSAEQHYAYINSLLERLGPVVRENGGIVEKYLGADITAIYPDRGEDAIRSSVRIIAIMEELNAQQAGGPDQKLDIGIGLYQGDVMLGTIGEEQRMECTMLLDNGNIPRHMCNMSAKLGVSILASESIMRSLEDGGRHFLHRYVGKVYFEGMAEPMKVYDIFQGNNTNIRTLRAHTRDTFEEGVALYEKGKFLEARTCFIDVLKHDREDGAARIYFYLSDKYYQTGQEPERGGALML